VPRLMMVMLAASALSWWGCSNHSCECVCTHGEQTMEAPADASVALAASPCPPLVSGLIFDRRPGLYSADQFTYRSDWPSTSAYYRAPEVIVYREYFRDRQGPGLPFYDNTYRRFDTIRYGAAVR